MSSAKFTKPCAVPAEEALERALAHLAGDGYALVARSNGHLSLRYVRGVSSAIHLGEAHHLLDLFADGNKLEIRFHDGVRGASFMSRKERAALEQRADALALAARTAPDISGHFRCRYCHELTPADEPTCRSCGGANFT
jgi:hypothetical protein